MGETKKKRKIPWFSLGLIAVVLLGIFLAGQSSGGALPSEADRALIEADIVVDYDLSDLRRGIDTQLCRALELF